MEKTEKETPVKPVALVKSPSKDAHLRVGDGFSLSEIKAAKKTVQQLKRNDIKIDYFRKSTHEFNVKLLKEFKAPSKKVKKKKKEQYKSKEERAKIKESRPKAKPKKVKKIEKVPIAKEKPLITEIAEEISSAKKDEPPKIKVKEPLPPKIKVKEPLPPKEKIEETTIDETEPETQTIPLTKLSGLGQATAKKLKEIGVDNVEKLCKENPAELCMLITGCTEEKIKKWIEEGKELLNK